MECWVRLKSVGGMDILRYLGKWGIEKTESIADYEWRCK